VKHTDAVTGLVRSRIREMQHITRLSVRASFEWVAAPIPAFRSRLCLGVNKLSEFFLSFGFTQLLVVIT